MTVEKVKVVDAVATADVAVDYSASAGTINMEPIMCQELPLSERIDTQVVLYIVIGICAVVGIVLGIIMGKRAANK